MSELKRLIGVVEATRDEADAIAGPQPDWMDRAAYATWSENRSKAQDHLKEALLEAGAKFNARPAVDFAIRLGGIRSTSTSGIEGAVGNWLAAARKRLEKEA
ncbi:MAG: hypothetical protein K5905_25695 [Roseibium sp.]|uniref:hypothetical protein n=1 Tax=Roseibium sp. TaxID=1936156 RepID=UPI0026067B53|nr:hypothetical protein [Roseibium sp.]MCV0428863.1 hypothetical protein [Roseibium sp.]